MSPRGIISPYLSCVLLPEDGTAALNLIQLCDVPENLDESLLFF